MSARYPDRKIAAALYLCAGGFFTLVIFILATSWGQGGLGQLFSVASEIRSSVIYLLVFTLFSFLAAVCLWMPHWLTSTRLIGLTRSALLLLLAGFYFAPPAVVVGGIPFWFLYRAQRAAAGSGIETPS